MSLKPAKIAVKNSWVSSSFDKTDVPEVIIKPKSVLLKKGKKDVKSFSNNNNNNNTETWVERFAPRTKDGLAVHWKKVEEVETWLRLNLYLPPDQRKCKGAPLLLLTGPAGAGKTVTIKVLCKELKIELKEWSSSPHETISSSVLFNETRKYGRDFSDILTQNQTTIFNNFLLRANRYPSLFSESRTVFKHRSILIEEFPNTFLRDPSSFHYILRKFYQVGRCPAVFIVSESAKGSSSEQQLFPKSIQAELSITNIRFNPVAPRTLVKAVESIYSNAKEVLKGNFSVSEETLEAICADSKGDIRNAVNALQFYCASSQNGKTNKRPSEIEKSPKKGRKCRRMRKKTSNHNSGTGKDSSLFLFHALAKVLYCKRDDTQEVSYEELPSHLNHLKRIPLLENPEEVFSKTAVSADVFTVYLHHNFLSFTESIESAAECFSWFSEADLISHVWSERETLNEYTPSLVARGLMFNLSVDSSKKRWTPLSKSPYYDNMKTNRELCQSLKAAFGVSRLTLKELQVDLVPYLSKMENIAFSEHHQLISQISEMPLSKSLRVNNESLLEENDLITPDIGSIENFNNDLTDIEKDPLICLPPEDSDEELIIEEYDF